LICAHCQHKLKDHCPSGVRHAAWKDEARMVRDPRVHTCTTRHCTQPLCSCVDFVEAA